MDKWTEWNAKESKDKKNVEEWYKNIKQQYEDDSKEHDFSLSKEWDEDFRKAMFGNSDKKGKKEYENGISNCFMWRLGLRCLFLWGLELHRMR